MSIRVCYLYRDYSNYKNFNEVVFSNITNKSVKDVEVFLREDLIDGEWFHASEWKLPDLHFDTWDIEDDHFLHEFESVEETNEAPTSKIDIIQFLAVVKQAKRTFV